MSGPESALEQAARKVMNRTAGQWSYMDPSAVAGGSLAQALYALRDAKHDIQALLALLATHAAALEQARAEGREAGVREAAAYVDGRTTSRSYGSWADAFEAAERGILALLQKEPKT